MFLRKIYLQHACKCMAVDYLSVKRIFNPFGWTSIHTPCSAYVKHGCCPVICSIHTGIMFGNVRKIRIFFFYIYCKEYGISITVGFWCSQCDSFICYSIVRCIQISLMVLICQDRFLIRIVSGICGIILNPLKNLSNKKFSNFQKILAFL